MVSSTIITAGRRAWSALRHDFSSVFDLGQDPWKPETGLYTYRFESGGARGRIHLRIEDDSSGVLFIDVTDVVHLNPTATTMAKLALDGIPFAAAHRRLMGLVDRVDKEVLALDLKRIYGMIEGLTSNADGCPTCAVTNLNRAPLFSVSAHAPYKADLALTYGCNNACGHCYNEPDRFAMPSLATEEWYSVLNRLHKLGVPHIIFTGGEATLHPALPALIRYAESLGLMTGLNTNGRRIADRAYMKILAEAGLNHVQVTLGSSRHDVHDAIMGARSFEQTVRGIRNAIESGIHCITNTTLMRCNKDHAIEIVDYLHELGIRTFAMNGMIYSGGGLHDPNALPEADMPPILVRVRDRAHELGMRFLWYTPTEYCRMSPVELELGAKRCNAAEYSICIEPNGDVLPCQSYYAAAGNILHDPWTSIWHSDLFRSFRQRGDDPRYHGLPEKCWDCPDLPLCGGGCRLEREARSGWPKPVFEGSGAISCSGSCGGNRRPTNGPASAGYTPTPRLGNGRQRARGNHIAVVDIGCDRPERMV